MTTEPVRLAVVGFGKLGLLHAALANGLPGCSLVAVADRASTMLSMLQTQMPNVAVYDDHRSLLEGSKVDGVLIATPTHLHVPIALDFIEAKIPVFIEKPLALTSQQSRPLLEALARKPVPNMVGYMSRQTDTFRKAKAILNSHALGQIQLLSSTMYISQLLKPGKGWRYNKATSGGGVLITQNSHMIDMLTWLFGEVEWVSAHASRFYSEEVEDAAHVYFGFKNGIRGWMDTSWSMRHHRTLTMNIFVQGENGTLQVNDDEVKLFLDEQAGGLSNGWTVWKKPDLFEGVSFDVGGPHYTRQAEEFVAAIRGQNSIESDVSSAHRLQAVLDAVYESAEHQGNKIEVARFL